MKLQIAFYCLVLVLALCAISEDASANAQAARKPDLSFRSVGYFHRYSKDGLHEYTPAGQQNLKAWTDMFTINVYAQAKDGDALAAVANTVLENYKAANGRVLKTSSVPRTDQKPAEHFIAVVFGTPEFIEVAFARFKMHNGIGTSVVYSRRIYGKKVGDAMSAWLKQHGAQVEADLMKWDALPEKLFPKT